MYWRNKLLINCLLVVLNTTTYPLCDINYRVHLQSCTPASSTQQDKSLQNTQLTPYTV